MKNYPRNPYQESRVYYLNELKIDKKNLNYRSTSNSIDQTIDRWLSGYFKLVSPFFEHEESVSNSYINNDIDLEFDNSSVNKLPSWLIKVMSFIELLFNKVFNLIKKVKIKQILKLCYSEIYKSTTKVLVYIKSKHPKAPPK